MLLSHIIAMALAIFVGLSLGALGSGGSIITIPLLVYVARIPAERAVGMSLVIVGTTSFLGALLNLRRGNLAIKPGLLFAATGMIGSYLGSAGTHLLSRRSLMLIFSGIMVIVGMIMWRGAVSWGRATSSNVSSCLLAGFGVGLLTGFLGIGGGFLIVPALVLFAGLESRVAAGTSLAVIALNSTTGALGQLRFVSIDWALVGGFLAFTLSGMVAGVSLAGRLADLRLRRIFASAVVIVAVAVGFANL